MELNTDRRGKRTMLFLVKVLDPITSSLVLAELRLVLLRVKS
jgi:hypothetical protein